MNKQPNLTKKIAAIFSVFLLLCFTSIKAQTLQPGDMAVIGWNALADKVHIVTLVNIQAGTVIKVTDRGWDQSTNAFTTSTTGDGIVTWTPSSAVPAGTVLELFLGGADDGTALINLTASTVLTTDIAVQGYTVNDAMLISGDQIFIYQGNDSNPRFIFGMNNSSGTVDATNWNTSIAQTLRDAMIPNGTGSQNALTNGTNAIGLPGGAAQRDNVQYVGPTTTADRNTWLARMANLSNWSGSDLNDITNPVTSAPTPIVNIASSNNPPTDIALSNASVNQSAGINAEVGTLTTTDPDAGNTFTYTFISGTGDTHNASFNISGNALRANNAATIPAGIYSVRIQTDDQHGGTFPKFFTITVVDDVAPTISSVAVPANSTYRTGQNLDFTVNVSEYVTVTGTPQLPLTIGSTSVNAFYHAGGSTATALLFRHTVQPGETDADGITVGASLDLNGGTITDGADLPLTLTLNSVGSTTGVLVDGTAPSVTGVDVPGDDTYALGETLSFTVNFNENVVVNTTGGNPRIPLTIGTNTRYATYVSNPVSDALLFTYTVVAGDNDTDGISVGTHIELNGSAIQDIAGNAAALTLNAIGATDGVRVDGVAPTVSTFSPANGSADMEPDADLLVTFSESITFGTGNIIIYNDAGTPIATINVESHSGQLSIADDVLTINPTADLLELTDYYVHIGNDAIHDLVGNAYLGINNNTTWAFTVADVTAPSGYAVSIDQAEITLANQTALSFTFSGAEVGTTFGYTITSSGGGTPVTGSGSVSTASQQISGIDVSGLSNGTLTLNATLTDNIGNEGIPAMDNVTKATNYPPVITTSGGVTTFTESVSGSPVPIDDNLTTSDPDNTTLASATVSITGSFQAAQDVLAFANDGTTMGDITASYNPSTGVLTLTSTGANASLAQWQAALRSVTYSNSSDAPNTANRTVSFVVNDGEDDSTPATKTVSVTAVNDAPMVAAPATIGVTEDMPSAITGISFSDADAGSSPVTVILSVASGSLAATSGGGVTVGGTSSAMTLSGSISNINAFVAGSNVSFTTAANATADVTLTVSINDGGNTGSGGALSASETVTLQVAAVNDAPTVTAPGSIAIIEDIPGALTGISFADVDAGSGNVTVTLSVPSGTLHATTGGGVTVGGTASALTLTGSIADINAFIAASGVSFTTASNATANITLTVSINDGGNTGSGGAQTDTSTVTLTVTAVNDPPTIDAPASIEVVENVATALTGISLDDVDAGSANVEVTFSIPNGRGTLLASPTATGSHTVVLEGTLAAINAYLATGNLSFRNSSGDLNDVQLGVTIDDMGNTGNGGPQTANEEVTITVRATVPRIVQVYSSTPDGLYGIGSLIDIHVEFDREVTATEVGDGINLLLNTGVAGRSASYVSGSGTKTLAFQYTVQTGDENTNLDYLNTNAFELSTGSTIESSEAGIDGNLTLPVVGSGSSLSDNNQLVVDGIVPNPIAKNITLTLDANGSATLSAADLNDGSTDNLTTEGDLGLAISQTEFNCADVGSVTVTLTVTDEAGNEASTTATVAVADVTGPTVLTKNVILALGTDGLATLTAQMIDRGSNDACGIADLTVSKTQFNSTNLGINTVTLTATDHSGNQSSATATVVVVAFEDASLVYDGTPKSLTIAGELPNGIQVTYTGNGQTQAGIYTVTASIEGGSNFNDLVLTAELEITKASLIGLITLDDASFVYDGTARSLSISGDLPNGASVSYTGNGQTDAGIYTVTADINGGNNYHSLVLNATLTINKAPQTITFVSPGTLTRDAGTVSLDVEANSNLPVTLSIDDEQIALLHGQDLEVRRLGTVIVTATQPGNHNYLPAEPVSVTIRIVNAADAALPIRVHKAVSPNGDGINDYLMIEGIRDYPENKITVFDKSGRVLAEIESYDNRDRVFTGQYVRDGTYYYYLDVKDGGQWKREKGFFVVKRTVN